MSLPVIDTHPTNIDLNGHMHEVLSKLNENFTKICLLSEVELKMFNLLFTSKHVISIIPDRLNVFIMIKHVI